MKLKKIVKNLFKPNKNKRNRKTSKEEYAINFQKQLEKDRKENGHKKQRRYLDK